MIRIKDIAKLAGVSTTTVSNVIHGNTNRVSPETIQRIQKIIQEVDYIPSMGARMLAGKKSSIIGVIVGINRNKTMQRITDPFLSAILGEIEAEIYKQEYYMIFHQADTAEDIMHLVSKWNVDGIITIGLSEKVNQMIKKMIVMPMVSVDVYYESLEQMEDIVNIGLDDYQGGYQMAEYLISRGLHSILYLAECDIGVDRQRYLGACDACRKQGNITNITIEAIQLPAERDKRLKLHMQNLSKYKEADALFFASDYYAVEGMFFLQKNGIRIPDKLSIAGFDDNFLAEMSNPTLTTVHQDIEQKGTEAVKALIKLIQGDSLDRNDKKLPVKIIVRESVQ